jgi:hypothetical protein
MKEVKAYQCSFCTYYRKTKSSVLRHEESCYHNPKNKACATCVYNVVDTDTVYNPYHGGDPGSTDYDVSYNWCEKKSITLEKGTLCMRCDLWESK